MQFRFHWLVLSLIVIQVITADGAAAIIALRADDSVGGFTTATPQLNDTPVNNVPPAGGNDGQWGFAAIASNAQSQVGNGNLETANLFNYVWISRADLGEDCPQLTTTIGGLSSSDAYNIYLYQATNDNVDSPWGLQAAISGNPLTTYQAGSGVELESIQTTNFERVLLGQVSGVISVDVIVDDTTNRGFLKGYGVELVPEPSGMILIGSMSAALLPWAWRRTRRRWSTGSVAKAEGTA